MSYPLLLELRTGEESSETTVAFDLYGGGDGVRKFLDSGFGVLGLELKGLASSIASKYSMFGWSTAEW